MAIKRPTAKDYLPPLVKKLRSRRERRKSRKNARVSVAKKDASLSTN